MASEFKAPFLWQQDAWLRLRDDIKNSRIAHALLLSGAKGIGKNLFATALCHSMLCQRATEAGACGDCKDCQLLAVGNHPDFRFVSLEEKAQAIKIDQIRELVTALAKTPQISKRHCVIIDPADCLNINASNALLKLLEEPQGDTVIILVSAYPQRLPATIRSRCQQSAFSSPPRTEALNWLKDTVLDDTESYLDLAKGAPLLARQLYEDNGLEANQELRDLLDKVLLGQANLVDAAAKLAARSDTQVVDAMLYWLYEASKIGLRAGTGPDQALNSETLPKTLNQLSSQGNTLALFRFHDKLLNIKRWLISSANPNKNLLWEECLLDWLALMKMAPRMTSQAINVSN